VLDGVDEVQLLAGDGTVVSSNTGRHYRITVKIDALRDVVTIHNDATRQVQLKKWSLLVPDSDLVHFRIVSFG
jgi:hypothetical protein